MQEIPIKRLVFVALLFCFTSLYAAFACEKWPRWFQPACFRLEQTWQGDTELYLSGYAWHNRYFYDPIRVKKYNENAWGGGLGKSFFDEKGNWHGLFAFAFLDSHSDIEPIAGYSYLKIFPITASIKTGIGFSLFITSRSDLYNRVPFPGALPWISLLIQKVTFSATYIPGHKNVGNVLFLFAKYRF